jgi:hypothetical protein
VKQVGMTEDNFGFNGTPDDGMSIVLFMMFKPGSR